MKRRTVSIALCIAVFCSLLPCSAFSEPVSVDVRINTSEGFILFAEKCTLDTYSEGRVFSLECDVDLTGRDFKGVPYFAGMLLGNGHTVSGLDISGDGSRLGLFRQIAESGSVKDLKVSGTVSPGGTACMIGGIAGENNGSISGCSFDGAVSGIENVGGIAGCVASTGGISSCTFSGSVSGEHGVGGIAGACSGGIISCTNRGSINAVPIVPKAEKRFDLSALKQDDFLDITDIGGISGENSGVVKSCSNRGDVGYLYTGYNVGGICGKSSGFISGCRNYSPINGRRDAGGIAGQLIPYSEWDFSEGKLDELKQAIEGLSAVIGNATGYMTGSASALSGELGRMNYYTVQALIELDELMSEYIESGQFDIDNITIDPETGQIDFSGITFDFGDTTDFTNALTNLCAEGNILSQAASNAVGNVALGLAGVMNQMNYVFSTLFKTVQGVSGLLVEREDLSVSEARSREIGAIADCRNFGSVKAENNAGGIAGTAGFEVEFDMEDTLNASSFISSNAKQYIFAAIRDCASNCCVTVKENCAGGIAGSMDVGIVLACSGAGSAVSQGGDYLGGIAGTSSGTLSGCWSRIALEGRKYEGGIAGQGNDIIDCKACCVFESGREYLGSVAGWVTGNAEGNIYAGDTGGIDGVSYAGKTDPVSYQELAGMEGAPDIFGSIKVTFTAEGRTVAVVPVGFGGSIPKLPDVPNDGSKYWKWDDFDSSHIYSSMEITGRYILPISTLSTGGDVPLFLVEGTFYNGQTVSYEPYSPPDTDAGEIIDAYTLTVNDYSDSFTVRFRTDMQGVLMTSRKDGQLVPASYSRDGSCIVFRLDNGGSFAYLKDHSPSTRALIFAGLAALFIGVTATAIAYSAKRRKRKR